MEKDTPESPHSTSKTESLTEGLFHSHPISEIDNLYVPDPLSKTNTTNTTPTSTFSKKGIDPLQAQADRLKLFVDPLGRSRRPSIPPTPNSTPRFPLNTPVSPFKPVNDILSEDPFSSRPTLDPFSPPIDSSQLNLFIGTSETVSRTRTESAPATRSASGNASRAASRTGSAASVPESVASSRRTSWADRRMSKEWDASKVPPSRFQRPEGSIFATQGSRDGHVDKNIQQRYKDKLKEKGWDK